MAFRIARARRQFSHVERPVVLGIKFRSKAEANYALYLDWLKKLGEIAEWLYEPRTFWFTPDAAALWQGSGLKGIRRGVTCYRPDFRVVTNLGAYEYHEVKGYMDNRSRVALARMARYYPGTIVKVIDKAQLVALKRQVGGIVGML